MTRRLMAGGRLAMLGAMLAAASEAGLEPPAKVLSDGELVDLARADPKSVGKTEADRMRLIAAEEKRRRRAEKKRK